MPRANHKFFHRHVAAVDERSTALGRIHLVPRHRQEVDAQRHKVDGNLTHALRRIGVAQRACGVGQPRRLAHRHEGANLIVRVHDSHQRRLAWPDRLLQRLDCTHALGIHRHLGELEPLHIPQETAHLQHRRMLDTRRHDMAPLLVGRPHRPRRPTDRPVVALRAARGERHVRLRLLRVQ